MVPVTWSLLRCQAALGPSQTFGSNTRFSEGSKILLIFYWTTPDDKGKTTAQLKKAKIRKGRRDSPTKLRDSSVILAGGAGQTLVTRGVHCEDAYWLSIPFNLEETRKALCLSKRTWRFKRLQSERCHYLAQQRPKGCRSLWKESGYRFKKRWVDSTSSTCAVLIWRTYKAYTHVNEQRQTVQTNAYIPLPSSA